MNGELSYGRKGYPAVCPSHPTVAYRRTKPPDAPDVFLCKGGFLLFMNKAKKQTRILRIVVFQAMLAAISIVMGKYLAINLGPVLRLSFENTPIIFSGIAFGPWAALTAVAADIIGCLLVGYEINPLVTLGAFSIGLISGTLGVLFRKIPKLPQYLKIITAVALSHLIGSVVIKTFGLSKFYDMPFMLLMAWRLLNYVIVGAAECVLIYALVRNKAISKMINENMNVSKNNNFSSFANSFQAVTVPGLERVSALLNRLGNPEEKLRFIHIAGTNGKGSVSANIASVLEEAGYKTGKYISPNLIRVNERISICGEEISDFDLERILALIEPLSREVQAECGIAPTQFEIWTALAFVYFSEKKCDYVVLEVGLGGEFDATNVIKSNVLAVITRLGIDHTQYLGNTMGEIAKAKCGIIKRESELSVLVTVEQESEAMKVIESSAEQKGSKLVVASPVSLGNEGCYERFSLDGEEYLAGIPGYHQIENAAIAVLACKKMGIDRETIKRGISKAKNPARFEIIEDNPPVIYDGGHNENGIAALNFSLERYFGKAPRTVIFACMADKDIKNSLKMLSACEAEFIYTTVKDNPRAMSANELSQRAEALGYPGAAFEDIGEAYYEAKKRGRLTVICGSLYLYRDFREFLDKK